MKKTIICLCLLLCVSIVDAKKKKGKGSGSVKEGLEKVDGPYKRPYYIMLPDNFDPETRYWLYVHAHGYNGNGQIVSKLRKFPHRNQCIMVGPSFPQNMKDGWYQMLGGGSDKQLDQIFKELKKKYKLHDRFMLEGHSGGSQFAHRYAMANNKSVLGCIATSGGTWGNDSSVPSWASGGRDRALFRRIQEHVRSARARLERSRHPLADPRE